jgi:hypothetical protein
MAYQTLEWSARSAAVVCGRRREEATMTPEETVEAFTAAFTNGEPARAVELAAVDIVYDNIGLGSTSFDSIVPTINGARAML